ncbi:protein Abitram [Culicoides brevitarsis]|uniref:protein Abitram n=1 Tax=Culicoides brevitarsis TaxID=469753 RepID=UPI00307B4A05
MKDDYHESFTADDIQNFPSVVDRFYEKFRYSYQTEENHLVLAHSNGIVLVQLCPEHPVFQSGIAEISYDVGQVDRSNNEVKGKSKRGGLVLQERTQLAVIRSKDGKEYKIVSPLAGKLVEVNKSLAENPDLVRKEGDGYVAIILPKQDVLKKEKVKWEQIGGPIVRIENV